MSDATTADSGAPKSPGWGVIGIIAVVGLVIIALLASIAPEGEHKAAKTGESVTAGSDSEPATGGGDTRPTAPPQGGAITTIAPRVGRAPTPGENEGEAHFTLVAGQCKVDK